MNIPTPKGCGIFKFIENLIIFNLISNRISETNQYIKSHNSKTYILHSEQRSLKMFSFP